MSSEPEQPDSDQQAVSLPRSAAERLRQTNRNARKRYQEVEEAYAVALLDFGSSDGARAAEGVARCIGGYASEVLAAFITEGEHVKPIERERYWRNACDFVTSNSRALWIAYFTPFRRARNLRRPNEDANDARLNKRYLDAVRTAIQFATWRYEASPRQGETSQPATLPTNRTEAKAAQVKTAHSAAEKEPTALDIFAEKSSREAAIRRATELHGSAKAVASWVSVDYRDLRSWARDRAQKFNKSGQSKKVTKIEQKLLPLV